MAATILEMFGVGPFDTELPELMKAGVCPFTASPCIKRLKSNGSSPSGVCVVSNGARPDPVIVCPNRMYGGDYDILRQIAADEFGAPLILQRHPSANEQFHSVGGRAVIAIPEVTLGGARLDWLLQYVDETGHGDFLVVEAQSMDTTGSYADTHADIVKHHASPDHLHSVRNSGHGINWKNVVKRLSTQIIEKGNYVKKYPDCRGFYFVLPDNVYRAFEKDVAHLRESDPEGLRVVVATLDVDPGLSRIQRKRTLTFSHDDVVVAFSQSDRADTDIRAAVKLATAHVIKPLPGGAEFFS